MATREENLKKINEELEKLDDEQLEQVAGGFLVRPFGPRKPRRNSAIGEDKIRSDSATVDMETGRL